MLKVISTCATAAAAMMAACVAGLTPLLVTARAVALVVVPTIWSRRAMVPSLKIIQINNISKTFFLRSLKCKICQNCKL